MTSDPTPVPAAPTPKTPQQITATWGDNATRTYPDEHVAPFLTVVQYGGLWSVVTGHRLPTAEIWQETTP